MDARNRHLVAGRVVAFALVAVLATPAQVACADDAAPAPERPVPTAPVTQPDARPSPLAPTAAPVVDDDDQRPIVEKWWFWATVGGVVVTTVAIFVLANQSGGPPATTLGNREAFKP